MTNQEAIKILGQYDVSDLHFYTTDGEEIPFTEWSDAIELAISALEKQDAPEANVGDTISRQAAIDALWKALYEYEDKTEKQFIDSEELDVADWIQHRNFVQNMSDTDRQTIIGLPSAQPERRCVNCGRTVNNGGWYEDGRTRCPIEEHYALPKDGYCHLWEKRKDWEDDYVKRAEEGEK